jgi:hypothetical protein
MGRVKAILAKLMGGAASSAIGLFLLFVRGLLVLSICGILVCAVQLVKSFRASPSAVAHQNDDHSDHAAGSEHTDTAHNDGEHGESAHTDDTGVRLGASPLPKAVLEAQDGVAEADKDLSEPELNDDRGLASLINNDLKVEFGPRFIELPQIIAGTRSGMNRDGVIVAEVTLEVRDREAQSNLQARITELQSVISGVVGETKMDDLSSAEGLTSLKQSIQNEINHMVGPGTVRDVLFNSIVKR